jgi:hypothetical protein
VSLGEGGFGVGGLEDRQFAVLEHQPGPAAAELGGPGVLEVGGEFVVTAQFGIDPRGDPAGRLASAARLQALPEKAVIPDLGGIVEQPFFRRIGGGRLDDGFQPLLGEGGAFDQFAGVVDLGLVVAKGSSGRVIGMAASCRWGDGGIETTILVRRGNFASAVSHPPVPPLSDRSVGPSQLRGQACYNEAGQ